jgi:hypothetical protein
VVGFVSVRLTRSSRLALKGFRGPEVQGRERRATGSEGVSIDKAICGWARDV